MTVECSALSETAASYPPSQSSENILEEGVKRIRAGDGENCEMLSFGHSVAATLPAALDTCTGASQQDQPPSQ